MQESIISGITPVDTADHIVINSYEPLAGPHEDVVEVVEIANNRLMHTRDIHDPQGHPAGKIAVFSRMVSAEVLADRIQEQVADPRAYHANLLKNLR